MKKYVIKDVEDKQYYCENNMWSDNINEALAFTLELDAWDVAANLHTVNSYVLTVIPVII